MARSSSSGSARALSFVIGEPASLSNGARARALERTDCCSISDETSALPPANSLKTCAVTATRARNSAGLRSGYVFQTDMLLLPPVVGLFQSQSPNNATLPHNAG